MLIVYLKLGKDLGEVCRVVLGIDSRSRNSAHIDDEFYIMWLQQTDEFADRPSQMANGEKSMRIVLR